MNEELIEKVNEILKNKPHTLDAEIETLCWCGYELNEIYDLINSGETMKVAKRLVEEEIITDKHFD